MTDDTAEWLYSSLEEVGAFSGTVHIVHHQQLALVASHNIPDAVRQVIETIPSGKGIAGQAWARGESVQVCNLQTDANPVIRPEARHVPAEGALAVPVYDGDGHVRAIVGFGFSTKEALTDPLVKAVELLAKTLPLLAAN